MDTNTDSTVLTRTFTRRVRNEDPLRLDTEKLHRLPDADLTVVVGGRPCSTSRQPSFR